MDTSLKESNYNLLRLPTVKAKTTLSEPTIYRLMKQGVFPKPIKIGNRAVAWIATEVEAFIGSRARSDAGNTEAFYE
jgi:prophage regulatory protein